MQHRSPHTYAENLILNEGWYIFEPVISNYAKLKNQLNRKNLIIKGKTCYILVKLKEEIEFINFIHLLTDKSRNKLRYIRREYLNTHIFKPAAMSSL